MRISDWSSDVCSSDLLDGRIVKQADDLIDQEGLGRRGLPPSRWMVEQAPADFDPPFGQCLLETRDDRLANFRGVTFMFRDNRDQTIGDCPAINNPPSACKTVKGFSHGLKLRSEKRRVGKEGVSTCESRW